MLEKNWQCMPDKDYYLIIWRAFGNTKKMNKPVLKSREDIGEESEDT